jgi:hypothetical protein
MPRFDGTGPFGQGPVGRGLGPCGAGRRIGFGPGFGCGSRGFGNFSGGWQRPRRGWAPWGGGMSATQWSGSNAGPQDEIQFLKQEASYLQNELDAIQKRLAELESA